MFKPVCVVLLAVGISVGSAWTGIGVSAATPGGSDSGVGHRPGPKPMKPQEKPRLFLLNILGLKPTRPQEMQKSFSALPSTATPDVPRKGMVYNANTGVDEFGQNILTDLDSAAGSPNLQFGFIPRS